MSIMLSNVPDEHKYRNGGSQYTIVIRAKTVKRVCELLKMSYGYLKNFGGIHKVNDQPQFTSIPTKDEVVYYQVQNSKAGISGWFEYTYPSY